MEDAFRELYVHSSQQTFLANVRRVRKVDQDAPITCGRKYVNIPKIHCQQHTFTPFQDFLMHDTEFMSRKDELKITKKGYSARKFHLAP
jgi:hypothetical protein